MTEEAKPATDEQMAAMRAYLKTEGSPRRWSRHSVVILIARIDAECAARRAAEARVKVLEEALSVPRVWTSAERDGMAAAFAEASKKHGHCESLFAAASWLLRHRAALKEPANG